MTMEMTAKEYLMQVCRIERHIRMLQRELDDLHLELLPGGIDYSGDKVQTNHNPDKFGGVVAKIDATERKIVTWIDRLVDAKERISKQILAMPNSRTAEILHCRYILLMKWEDIAVKTNTDLRWVYRLHGQGLAEFSRQYSPLKATKHI